MDDNDIAAFLGEVLTPKPKAGELKVFPTKPLMGYFRWALDVHLSNLINHWGYEAVREFVKEHFQLCEPIVADANEFQKN